MNIILDSNEFTEAVECYLTKRGFNPAKYDITTKVVQGRGASSTRVEVSLDEKTDEKTPDNNVAVEVSIDKPPFDTTEEPKPTKTIGSMFGTGE